MPLHPGCRFEMSGHVFKHSNSCKNMNSQHPNTLPQNIPTKYLFRRYLDVHWKPKKRWGKTSVTWFVTLYVLILHIPRPMLFNGLFEFISNYCTLETSAWLICNIVNAFFCFGGRARFIGRVARGSLGSLFQKHCSWSLLQQPGSPFGGPWRFGWRFRKSHDGTTCFFQLAFFVCHSPPILHKHWDTNQPFDQPPEWSKHSRDSWMYPYQHAPMGNPYISPISRGYLWVIIPKNPFWNTINTMGPTRTWTGPPPVLVPWNIQIHHTSLFLFLPPGPRRRDILWSGISEQYPLSMPMKLECQSLSFSDILTLKCG